MDLGAILGHWCRKLAQSREFTLVIPGTSSALPSTTQHSPATLCTVAVLTDEDRTLLSLGRHL